tara:strand:- start:520 stop:1293 length:774 start_codon:yes stop_codon:yes gene_type:complete
LPKSKNNCEHVGVLSAMPEEVGIILSNLKSIKSSKFGDLELYFGKIILDNSREILVTTGWSGWGKVSAARATTRLLSSNFDAKPIDTVIFTGVAGAVDPKLKKWDIILADSVVQHDMDARPIFDKYVIPALNNKEIIPNMDFLDKTYDRLKKELNKKSFSEFGNLYKGLIATGDMFISSREKINQLSKEISRLYAVEMEGAAFAQVAFQEKVNWIVLRIISDEANETASTDFNKFLSEYKLKSFDLIKSAINAVSIN